MAFPFQATLEPDGQKSHWLKVDHKLSEAASAEEGDIVTLEIAPAAEEPEPDLPTDLRKALAGVVVGHHAARAPRLDPLDYLCKTVRDSRAPDQECLLDARCREATRLLLRSVRLLR